MGLTRMQGRRPAATKRAVEDLLQDRGRRSVFLQERNDDRIAAQDLHELGFLSGIFDGHRGQRLAVSLREGTPWYAT